MTLKLTRAKIKKRFEKAIKSGISVVLAFVMAFSALLSFQLNFPAEAATTNSQTKYDNITDFQKQRWVEIQREVFGTDDIPTDSYTDTPKTANGVRGDDVEPGNDYFNWVDTGLTAWNGGKSTVTAEETTEAYTYENKDASKSMSVKYHVFNVSNPRQFRYVIENLETLQTAAGGHAAYVKINLENDLDMGGQNGVIWDPVDICYGRNISGTNKYKKYLYIEGNGYTIYNLRIEANVGNTAVTEIKAAGIFARPPAFMVAKNLGFKSAMVINAANSTSSENRSNVAGLLSGFAPQKFYFYNLHVDGGYYQIHDKSATSGSTGIGGLIGRKNITASCNRTYPGLYGDALEGQDLGDCFFENCSTSNLYMYGSDHIGGLTSFMGTHIDAKEAGYDAVMPSNPEYYVFKLAKTSGAINTLNTGQVGASTADARLEYLLEENYYPILLKNCSSTDSTIFSTGHDSGAFISCGHSIVAENCFTNNTIYATDNTGGFIGRAVNDAHPNIKDANGNYAIGSVFRNCYSSGIVEGSVAMGGFVGLDCGARHQEYIEKAADTSDSTYNPSNGYSKRSNLYENCYTTAMVGMDYAGKYCGGFIGLDDNYNRYTRKFNTTNGSGSQTATINSGSAKNLPTVYADGEKYRGRGSFYVNCYAAGEVGNILTVTEVNSNTRSLEKNFFKQKHNNVQWDSSGVATDGSGKKKSDVLNYYPTGGFVGSIGLDIYNYKDSATVPTGAAGTFVNCYYDMQTTAMHEMAVGLEHASTYQDTGGVPSTDFMITGVKGLYTVDSYLKDYPGLTGPPNGQAFAMDQAGLSGIGGTTWEYNNEYYPQLGVYMKSDTDLSNIEPNNVTNSKISDLAKESEFYIESVAYSKDPAERSQPVFSLGNPNNDKDYIGKTNITESSSKSGRLRNASMLSEVVKAYRYSQASTSTVMLNHWDYTKDTSESYNIQEDWVANAPQNKMTSIDTNGDGNPDEWQVSYENVDKGDYEFKIAAGTPNISYGRTLYGGDAADNIKLHLRSKASRVTIRFAYEGFKTSNYYVKADISYEDGTSESLTLTDPKPTGYNVVKYTVAGSLPNQTWIADANSDYTMVYQGDEKTYKLSIPDLAAGTYYFKITDGNGWTNNWGMDGIMNGNNMEFTLTNTATVTITFDESTSLCSVTAEPASYLTNVITQENKIDFTGYSVITSSNQITGYEWLGTKEGKEEEAATAGKLTYNETTGLYEAAFSLSLTDENLASNTDKNYAYKVIKDAIDEGANRGFYVKKPDDPTVTSIPLIFSYNEKTGETTVTSTIENIVLPYAQASTYSVVGVKELTGYEWLESDVAGQAGLMTEVSDNIFEKTYTGIAPGSYAFKVVPDCLDGKWDFPVNYGNSDGDNYEITIKPTYTDSNGNEQTVTTCDVTIKFDLLTGRINVTTNPAEAIKITEYVLMGTKALMSGTEAATGETIGEWNKEKPLMTLQDNGHYHITLQDVKANDADNAIFDLTNLPNYNYAFKVIEKGIDTGANETFVLKGNENETFDLLFDYNPYSKTTAITVYDQNGNDVTETVLSHNVEIYFYSILGDEDLTNRDWGISNASEAAYEGLMKDENLDGIYEKTYKVQVPFGKVKQYAFKVAANGTFSSGLSWGPNGLNDNSNVIVSVSSNVESIAQADLTIYFDSRSGAITYALNPASVNTEIDDSALEWYVYTDLSTLRSNNSYEYDLRVYDTVRDITSGFTFTCGQSTIQRGLTWQIDDEYNKVSGFKNSSSFKIKYKQENVDITGTFKTDIVSMHVHPIFDNFYSNIGMPVPNGTRLDALVQYYVDNFMPGKQWIKVNAIGQGYDETFDTWKEDYIAYQEYLDAKDRFEYYFELYFNALGGSTFVESLEGVVTEDNLLEYLELYPKELNKIKMPDGVTIFSLKQTMDSLKVNEPSTQYPSVDNQTVVGSRKLRLIPTAYLEAGNDAKVNVIQATDDASGATAINTVRYETKNSEQGTSYALTEGVLGDKAFTYYNFAVTAAYLSTDKVGLGIYNNYNDQYKQTYKKALIRNDDLEEFRNSGPDDSSGDYRYFAMSSAYNNKIGDDPDNPRNQSSDASRAINGSASYSDGGSRKTANLKVGEYVNLSIIGNSMFEETEEYDDDGKQIIKKGETIYEVYKQVPNGSYQTELKLVDMENAANKAKWNGLQKFTDVDAGTYTIKAYWVLSDGRYLEDQKDVIIYALEPALVKTVNKEYDGTGKNNELIYKITYTNDKATENLNFAILDVLPYDNSFRFFETRYKLAVAQYLDILKDKATEDTIIEYLEANPDVDTEIATQIGLGEGETLISIYNDMEQAKIDSMPSNTSIDINNSITYDIYFDKYLEILEGTTYTGSAEGVVTADNMVDYLNANEDVLKSVAKKVGLTGDTTLFSLNSESAQALYDEYFDKYYEKLKGVEFPNSVRGKVTMGTLYAYLKNNPDVAESVGKEVGLPEGTTLLTLRSQLGKVSFDLTALSITSSNPDTMIKGIYYSDFDTVYKSDFYNGPIDPLDNECATYLGLTALRKGDTTNGEISGKATNYFKAIDKDTSLGDDNSEYAFGEREVDIKNVTAIALTGINLGVGESVTLSFKLRYEAKPKDYFVNNAHFHVIGQVTDDANVLDGCAPVKTKIVTRVVSGYSWLDVNKNGTYDSTEPPISNLLAKLYLKNSDGSLTDTGKTFVTDCNGYYKFEDVLAGDYVVKFEANEGGSPITYETDFGYMQTVRFADLKLPETFVEVDYNDELHSSQNIFSPSYVTNETTKREELESANLPISFPTNSEVYYNRFPQDKPSYILNSENDTDDGIYYKSLQNGGFYGPDCINKITINKFEDGKELLPGASFMLEFKYKDKWYPVYLDPDTKKPVFDNKNTKTVEELEKAGIEYAFTTDENGQLTVDGLITADYRITELGYYVSTATPDEASGDQIKIPYTNILTSPVYVSLPYEIKSEDIADYEDEFGVKLEDDASKYYEINGVRYYTEVSMNISNPSLPNLPLTGEGFFLPLIIGISAFGVAMIIFVVSRKKSKKA